MCTHPLASRPCCSSFGFQAMPWNPERRAPPNIAPAAARATLVTCQQQEPPLSKARHHGLPKGMRWEDAVPGLHFQNDPEDGCGWPGAPLLAPLAPPGTPMLTAEPNLWRGALLPEAASASLVIRLCSRLDAVALDGELPACTALAVWDRRRRPGHISRWARANVAPRYGPIPGVF
jgi:hypothetical protein